MAPKKKWTDIQLIEAVQQSDSIADTLRTLGLPIHGSSYSTIKTHIKRLDLSVVHWTRTKNLKIPNSKKSIEEVFVEHSTTARHTVKKKLIREGLLKNECAICGLGPVWHSKPIVMVIDHINGIPNDNRIENLRLLCPNCNSQTPTFTGRNIKWVTVKRGCVGCGNPVSAANKSGYCPRCMSKYLFTGKNNAERQSATKTCIVCGKPRWKGDKYCSYECARLRQHKTKRPEKEILAQEIQETKNWSALGRKYGVSDNAVRKWAKQYGLI